MAPSTSMLGSYAVYPAPPGHMPISMKCVKGPASYTAISTGTPPTNGWLVKASDLGLVGFEAVLNAVSDNGQYEAIAMPAAAQNSPQTQVRFMIRTAATGAEISTTDLTGRTFLIIAFGGA